MWRVLVALVWCVAAGAGELRFANWSGTNITLLVDGVPYAVGLGETTVEVGEPLNVAATDGLWNYGPVDLSGVDWAETESVFLELVGGVLRVVRVERSSIQWAAYGFAFGVMVFGWGFVYRIVRGVRTYGEP